MELTSGASAVILPTGFFLSISAYSFHKACNMPTTTNHCSAKSLVSACLIGTERGTRDQKVAGSNPDRSAEEISSPESTFCASSYFSIRSAPVLPQQHVKDGRVQLITHAPDVCDFEKHCMVNGCIPVL